MNVFEMVLGVVIVTCIMKVLISFFRRRPSQDERMLEQRLRRVESLEERVRVLEQIVTDRRPDLRREFEDLERSR
jgi:hypothetical protein